jgi:hypothetical protein
MNFTRSVLSVLSIVSLGGSIVVAQPREEWGPYEDIAGGRWGYAEQFVNGKLNQCQIVTVATATNGSSQSRIIIAALSKGSLLISINDPDWKNRISMDYGWKQNHEFPNVSFMVNGKAVQSTGYIISEDQFGVHPKSKSEFLASGIFSTEDFAVVVGGITYKSFNAPKLPIAWDRFKKCKLV